MSAPSAPEAIASVVDRIDLSQIAPGRKRLLVSLGRDASGADMTVPVMMIRSPNPGPVVGITAAIHGNELNGIPVIHRLFRTDALEQLQRGSVIAVPILNRPGFLANQREFQDGTDLNRIMPGRPNGNSSEVYAHRVFDRIVTSFEYLLDLHTASFGRENSFYVRADMERPVIAAMARRIMPQVIVHNGSGDGTLRRAATDHGIHAVTLEVGNPQRLQLGLVRSSRLGIQEVLEHLEMIPNVDDPTIDETVECARSYWIYTNEGGLLEGLPKLLERFRAGDVVAKLYDIWGDLIQEYRAPEDGIVVGRSTNPVASPGSRVLHLGVERSSKPTD